MARENMSLTPGDIEEAERIFADAGLALSLLRFGLSPDNSRWCLFRADTNEMLACRIYPSNVWTLMP